MQQNNLVATVQPPPMEHTTAISGSGRGISGNGHVSRTFSLQPSRSIIGSCDEDDLEHVEAPLCRTPTARGGSASQVTLPEETCCYVFARKRCKCCARRRRRVGRTTRLRKHLEPCINDPNVCLERWQRNFLLNQTLVHLEEFEYRHTSNQWWFQTLKRLLKFLTVLLPALVVAEKTPYVQESDTTKMVMFFVMMVLTLQVNYLSGVLTDFAYLKRMVLFSEAKTSLHVMLDNFLTRTQRYGGFKRQSDAFRTFKRDEGALRLMVMQRDNFLHTGSQEQLEQSTNAVVAKRREFSTLFDPIDDEEERLMFEKRSKLLHRQSASHARLHTATTAHDSSTPSDGNSIIVEVEENGPTDSLESRLAAAITLDTSGSSDNAAAAQAGLRRRITPPKTLPVSAATTAAVQAGLRRRITPPKTLPVSAATTAAAPTRMVIPDAIEDASVVMMP